MAEIKRPTEINRSFRDRLISGKREISAKI